MTLLKVQVAPLQSPLKVLKVYPVLALAVQVLSEPWATGLAVHVTVPPKLGLAVVVMA